MKHTRVVSTKCTPGFACRAFSDTTLVCFIVNEHTTKCSRYSIIPADCVQYLILEKVYGNNNNKDPMERAVLHLNIKTQIV